MLPLPAGRRPGSAERLIEPVLHWTVRGSARISVDGRERVVSAGAALWVPAGSAVEVRASADAVVVPVPGLRVGDERADVFIEVPDSWRPWLLRAFAEALGYLDDASCRGLLQGLLDDAVGSSPNISFPPTPTTPELAALVAVFVRSPAIPLLEIARRRLSGWSPRTVQRRFLSETGLSPGSGRAGPGSRSPQTCCATAARSRRSRTPPDTRR